MPQPETEKSTNVVPSVKVSKVTSQLRRPLYLSCLRIGFVAKLVGGRRNRRCAGGSDISQYIRFERNDVTKFRICNRSNDNIHVDKFS